MLMNEDYVSFEVAKLLKEEHFNWACQAFYDNDGAFIVSPVHTINDELNGLDIACPTLYAAQKWLREEKGIHIVVVPQSNRENMTIRYTCQIITMFDFSIGEGLSRDKYECKFYDAYEECLNDAILGELKLIL